MRAGCTDVNRVATRSPQFVFPTLKLGRSSKPKIRIGTRYNLANSMAHSVGVCFPYPASAFGVNLTALLVLYLADVWGRSTLVLLQVYDGMEAEAPDFDAIYCEIRKNVGWLTPRGFSE